MTAPVPVETEPLPPTPGQRFAAGALVALMVLWAIGTWFVGMLLTSLSSGTDQSMVGYAMGAALVVGMPVAVLVTQGARGAGIAWGVFLGLAVLFVPTCGLLLGG